MSEYAAVPDAIVNKLRAICTPLPDAYQERAWTGTRWRVRQRTFAHVFALAGGSPSAHARAARSSGDVVCLTFRAAGDELDALRHAAHPFFSVDWGRDVVGLILDAKVDWDELGELLTESYRVLAPKKLTTLVQRPPSPDDA